MRTHAYLPLLLLALLASQIDAAPKEIDRKTLAQDDLKIEETGEDKERSKKSTTTFCVEIHGNCQNGEPTGQTVSIVQPDRPGALLTISPKSQPGPFGRLAGSDEPLFVQRSTEPKGMDGPMPDEKTPHMENLDALDQALLVEPPEQRAFKRAYKDCVRDQVLSSLKYKSASAFMEDVDRCFEKASEMYPGARDKVARSSFLPVEGDSTLYFPQLGRVDANHLFAMARENGADVNANGNSLKEANNGGVLPMYRETGNAPSDQPASDSMSQQAGQPTSDSTSQPASQPASEVVVQPPSEPAAQPPAEISSPSVPKEASEPSTQSPVIVASDVAKQSPPEAAAQLVPKQSQQVSKPAVEVALNSNAEATAKSAEVPTIQPVARPTDEVVDAAMFKPLPIIPCEKYHEVLIQTDAGPVTHTIRHSMSNEITQELHEPNAVLRGEPVIAETIVPAARNAATEPIPGPVPEPAAEVMPEPAAQSVPEPAAEPMPEPAVQPVPGAAAEAMPVSEPAAASSVRQGSPEPIAEPIAVKAVDPVPQPIPEPAVRPIAESAPQTASAPVSASATRDAAPEPVAQPISQETVQPPAQIDSASVPRPANEEPISKPAPQQAPESSVRGVSESQPISQPLPNPMAPSASEPAVRTASDLEKPSSGKLVPLPYERVKDHSSSARSKSERIAIEATSTSVEADLGLLPVPRPCKKKMVLVQHNPCMILPEPAFPPLAAVVQMPQALPGHCQCGCSHAVVPSCAHHGAYVRSPKSRMYVMRKRPKDLGISEHADDEDDMAESM